MSDTADGSADTIHELVGAYSIGALDLDDFDLFEQHLQTCGQCQADLDQIENAAAKLALAQAEPLPGDFVQKALQQLPLENVVPLRPRRSMVKAAIVAAAAAVVIVVGVAVAGFLGDESHLERIETATDVTIVALEGETSDLTLVVSVSENGVGFVEQAVDEIEDGHRIALWHLDSAGQPAFLGILRPDEAGFVSQSWEVDPSGASAFALSIEVIAPDPPSTPSDRVTHVGQVTGNFPS